MEILQSQLQDGVEKLQNFQKQQQKALASRQMLDSQLNENKLVRLPGMPDFAWYKLRKWGKCTKWPKIYQMAKKYTKMPLKCIKCS
jgi:hypothetical protein